jgi:hypothetical protein
MLSCNRGAKLSVMVWEKITTLWKNGNDLQKENQ